MIKEMARRKTETQKHRTEFQLYINWKSARLDNVCDFTERRLFKLANSTKDKNLKSKLLELLANYKKSQIAVAWTEGEPAWCDLNQESK